MTRERDWKRAQKERHKARFGRVVKQVWQWDDEDAERFINQNHESWPVCSEPCCSRGDCAVRKFKPLKEDLELMK